MSTLQERLDVLPKTRRAEVEARANELIAEFPDRPPIELSDLTTMEDDNKKRTKDGK